MVFPLRSILTPTYYHAGPRAIQVICQRGWRPSRGRTFKIGAMYRAGMSVSAVGGTHPTVFEADLPTVSYMDAPSPRAAHAVLKLAREQFPIAMGPMGPEI